MDALDHRHGAHPCIGAQRPRCRWLGAYGDHQDSLELDALLLAKAEEGQSAIAGGKDRREHLLVRLGRFDQAWV